MALLLWTYSSFFSSSSELAALLPLFLLSRLLNLSLFLRMVLDGFGLGLAVVVVVVVLSAFLLREKRFRLRKRRERALVALDAAVEVEVDGSAVVASTGLLERQQQ